MASIYNRLKHKLLFLLKDICCVKILVVLVVILFSLIAFLNIFSCTDNCEDIRNKNEFTCHVPALNPFDPVIMKLVSKTPRPLNCQDHAQFPLLFNSRVSPYPHLVPAKTSEKMKSMDVRKCYYQQVVRNEDEDLPLLADQIYKLEISKFPVSLDNETRIPVEHEFIAITCVMGKLMKSKPLNRSAYRVILRHVVDVHAFVHEKHPTEDVVAAHNDIMQTDHLNVIILGIDSLSRMSFIRSMRDTHTYLMNKLGAVEMKGYHKIGDNTFPNIAPMLTNQPTDGFVLECESKNNMSLDNCPFIWNQYKEAGYVTLFAEDEMSLATFNFLKGGFVTKPTDNYLRTFTLAADKLIGHQKRQFTTTCYGPRPAFQVMLDYLQKMSYVMRKHEKPYFQFAWSSSVTHDILNGGKLIDGTLLDILQWWNDEGYLNDTVLVLMSDHGVRWGDIHNHYQGKLEDRLPFMYFVLPSWFKSKYRRAYENLIRNGDRLMTSVDLHHALRDILHLSSVTDENLRAHREDTLSASWELSPEELNIGISLFLPIPQNRTCKMAGIQDSYCTCNHKIKELSPTDPLTEAAANFAVKSINAIISNFTQCAVLSLAKVLRIGQVSFEKSNIKEKGIVWKRYQLSFLTIPGYATFDAFLLWDDGNGNWSVSGVIERTNLYGNQSQCVFNKRAKLYCYCAKDQLTRKSRPIEEWYRNSRSKYLIN